MKNLLLICCILVSGCATTDIVGTKDWLKVKEAEYEQALADGKIDYYQCQELKSKAQQAVATVTAGRLSRPFIPEQQPTKVVVHDYN